MDSSAPAHHTSSSRQHRRRFSIGRRLFYSHLLVALLVASGLGAYLHWAAEEELRSALELRLVDNARLAGEALGEPAWDAIRTPNDTQLPEYGRLQGRLGEIAGRNPAIERMLVVRLNEDVPEVVADSWGGTRGYSPGDRVGGAGLRGAETRSARSLADVAQGFNGSGPVAGGDRYVVLVKVQVGDIQRKLQELRLNSAVSFVLAVSLALAMSVWLARSARQVLRGFAARFRAIAEGSELQPMRWRFDDEFSDLGFALDDMTARIEQAGQEREAALQEAREAAAQLQELVRERSEELERLNLMLRSEIEQRCQLEAALAEAAATDSTTQLLNRRGMVEALEHAAEQARRRHSSFIVLVCDVDHFKRVNDQFGHQVGDQVLIALGHALKNALQPDDAAGRWGGEEFLLLWVGTDLTAAELRARRLCEQIAATPLYPQAPPVTVSIGLTEFTALDNLDRCITRADKALYRAKEAGRNRVCVNV